MNSSPFSFSFKSDSIPYIPLFLSFYLSARRVASEESCPAPKKREPEEGAFLTRERERRRRDPPGYRSITVDRRAQKKPRRYGQDGIRPFVHAGISHGDTPDRFEFDRAVSRGGVDLELVGPDGADERIRTARRPARLRTARTGRYFNNTARATFAPNLVSIRMKYTPDAASVPWSVRPFHVSRQSPGPNRSPFASVRTREPVTA